MTPGVEAAVEIAEGYGLRTVEPLVLQDTNSTVVWLTPHPVVAKVATGKQTQPSVVREHDVCRHLGNVLSTAAGPRWIDFEAVSYGPLEWDLAFLTDDAVATFPDVEPRLLAVLRPLNSARVATWCWARADLPGMRSHAEHHLEIVRRAIA